jgi:hypothetical protein
MRDVARELFVTQSLTPAAIEKALLHRFQEASDFPSRRAIESWVAAFRTEGGEPWALTPGTDETAEYVLPVLQAVAEHSEGRVRRIGVETARWVVVVRRAAHDLDPWRAYIVARWYAAAIASAVSTVGLDLLLAYAPWRGDSEAERYALALAKGRVPVPLPGLWDMSTWPEVREAGARLLERDPQLPYRDDAPASDEERPSPSPSELHWKLTTWAKSMEGPADDDAGV